MANATKELNDKKKALVKAEKDLAKASKTHSDLLGEVARLDMLERSLKALVEGTEPPQNIKYVYNYPNWIWSYPWWWGTQYNSVPPYYFPYNYIYNTVTGTNSWGANTGTYQGGTYYNSGVDSGSITVNTVPVTTCSNSNTVNTVASTLSSYPVTATCSNTFNVGSCSSTLNAGPWNTVNTSTTGDLVIDLSTSATDESSDIKASESTESLVVGVGEN